MQPAPDQERRIRGSHRIYVTNMFLAGNSARKEIMLNPPCIHFGWFPRNKTIYVYCQLA